jgi:hypothetical protein
LSIEDVGRIRESTVFKTLDVGRVMTGVPVPLPLVAEMYEKIGPKGN